MPDSNSAQENRVLTQTQNDVLRIEKQVFIDAYLELAKQEEIQAFSMLSAIEQLEKAVQSLKKIVQADRTECAKQKFQQLFLSHTEWVELLTDDRIQSWQDEANH